MFNVEFLHVLREFEFSRVVPFIKPGSKVLEIGGGTGYQARRLVESGFDVVSIDLPNSIYASVQREFDVRPYDGKRIPAPDRMFDVVFSSNVLEHIPDLSALHSEVRRVLKPGGYCVHVMPTGTWRLWTNVAHYIELMQRISTQLARIPPKLWSAEARVQARYEFGEIYKTAKHYLFVPRHGEFGNAFTEIYSFGMLRWRRHFGKSGFQVQRSVPVGLFYTGHMVLGKRLPLGVRCGVAKLFGSACRVYLVRPVDHRSATHLEAA